MDLVSWSIWYTGLMVYWPGLFGRLVYGPLGLIAYLPTGGGICDGGQQQQQKSSKGGRMLRKFGPRGAHEGPACPSVRPPARQL